MPDVAVCPACGGALFAGRCLPCNLRQWSRFVHREIVLLTVLSGVAAATFAVTRAIAAGDERLRVQQAAFWFDIAQDELRQGRTEEALEALRRAALKDRRNRQYRLALGRTLPASGRHEEARRMLLALRDEAPEDPATNLALARLDASYGDGDAARRYYEAALAALWRPEQAERLRALRLELIDLLLERDERARALSQLLILSPTVPDDASAQVAVGRRFLDAADARRALDHFSHALGLEPGHEAALAGAGEAAFALGDYTGARRYFAGVASPDARTAGLRELARLVLTANPLAARLAASERVQRVTAGLTQATTRLDACLADAAPEAPGRAALEALEAEAASLAPVGRRASRDLVENAFDLVYRIEAAAEAQCPASAAPLDRALLLIGRQRGFDER